MTNEEQLAERIVATPSSTNVIQTVGPQSEIITLDLIKTAFPNLLHSYSSYTYSLTLSAMTPADYDKMLNDPSGYQPNHIMIASAGRWDGTAQKDPRFNVDFFFDKLDFETVIGMTTQSRNSNALSSEFTIIEPYGMTLLNRLIDMSNDINIENKGNYIQLPYMLQIDFIGYDANGLSVQIPNITKYIPIQIVGIKFKIGVKGTEYNISAVPYSHQAFSETLGTTPSRVEVAASTVYDFFKSYHTTNLSEEESQTKSVVIYNNESGKYTPAQRAQVRQQLANTTNPAARKTLQGVVTVQEANQATMSSKNTKSYAEAINAWYQKLLTDKKVEVADEIQFEIDPEIAAAKFPDKEVISKGNRNMPKNNSSSQNTLYSNLDDSSNPVGLITINEGTSIIDVIGLAIRNSTYITKQFLDSTKDDVTEAKMKEFLDKPLNWFIITPEVRILEFDKTNNRYGKKITYHIDKKVIPQTKNPEAPLGGPDKVCKDYQYIFTGKNQDILNFDLNFDTQFYVVNPANAANADTTAQNNAKTPSESQKVEDRILGNEEIQERLSNRAAGINELRPKNVKVASITGTGNPEGSTALLAQQLEKNILSTPGGDMIQVTLKIVGDPDFIKQDDCFYGRNNIGKDLRKTPNGSLITDAADLYVNLTFKTPVDYDNSGLASPTADKDQYSSSLFSGIYRVITVKNHFSNGKFEQELTLIRHSLQITAGLPAIVTDNKSTQRSDATTPATNLLPKNVLTNKPKVPVTEIARAPAGIANSVPKQQQPIPIDITALQNNFNKSLANSNNLKQVYNNLAAQDPNSTATKIAYANFVQAEETTSNRYSALNNAQRAASLL